MPSSEVPSSGQDPAPGDSRWVPFSHRLVGVLVGGLIRFFGVLPLSFGYLFADVAAVPLLVVALWHERKVRRKGRGIFRNQRIVYRERWNRRFGRRLLVGWARHLMRLGIDCCRLPRITAANLDMHVDTRDLEMLQPFVAAGRGLICVTGHIGVWELCGHIASLKGNATTAIFRPTGLEPVNEVLTRTRSSGGQKVLAKWGVLWSLKKALDRGEVIGMVADENARKNPVFAPFLGTIAATQTSAATLHRNTGVPIAVVSCARTGRGLFRFHVWKVIHHEKTDDRDADLQSICVEINGGLSEAILAYPEQWFWSGRRFETRPPGEELDADGLPPRAPGAATAAEFSVGAS